MGGAAGGRACGGGVPGLRNDGAEPKYTAHTMLRGTVGAPKSSTGAHAPRGYTEYLLTAPSTS